MELQEFESRLKQAVGERRRELDSRQLPQLANDLQMMVSVSATISSALAKKSVFHNSSIRYNDPIEDITPPSEDLVPEGREKIYVIGTRFGQYMAMLEYAMQHYQFCCDFLTPARISKLNALLRSFSWGSLNSSAENPNTRAFADIVQEFKGCGDAVAINIVTSGVSQLATALASCQKALKDVSIFQREAYKLEVRTKVMPKAGLPAGAQADNDSLKAIKKAFSQAMHGEPFYTDLIKEMLAENGGQDAESRREEALSRLAGGGQEKKKKKAEVKEDPRVWLAASARALGGAAQQLSLIADKLAENLKIYQDSRTTVFSKLKDLFRRAFNIPAKEVEITISVPNSSGQGQKRETIRFNAFVEGLKRRARLLSSLAARSSGAGQKPGQTDRQFFDEISQNISEVGASLRQCAGFDEFFKASVKGEAKSKVRGIKIEISAIQNAIHKANKMRAEYSSRIEEQEQLKKLGIV